LTGTRDSRLAIGKRLGADFTINVRQETSRSRREITSGKGADSVLGAPAARLRCRTRSRRQARLVASVWWRGTRAGADDMTSRAQQCPDLRARGEGGMNPAARWRS